MKTKLVLIAGATGLVGEHVLKYLLSNEFFEKVYSAGRREVPFEHEKLEQIIVNFDDEIDELPECDHIYCCLGTTMAKAGSKDAFKKVDYTYPLKLGKKAKADGSGYSIISALGADAESSFFYNKVKGEIENDLASLELNQLIIHRPSLLLGDRNDNRFGETIGKWMSKIFWFLFFGPLKKYKPIKAKKVAASMVTESLKEHDKKVIFVDSKQMQKAIEI